MRAIVLGAGGQLGRELADELRRRNVKVLAAGRKHLDITVAEAVDALVDRHRPDWIFNAAAYNLVDKAESEPGKAMEVNGLAVRSIAQAAQRAGAAFVHYSTDHVFDGRQEQPYTEDDIPFPPSAYGVSKLAGEHYARIGCERAYVVRVAGVFGPAGRYTNRGNFPELVLKKAAAGEPLKVVDDFFASPTYAVPLVDRSIQLLKRGEPGLYHIGGGETISWFDYARKILEAAGLEADLQPTNRREYVTPARRPLHAGLANRKLAALGLAPMPDLGESLPDYLKRRETTPPPSEPEPGSKSAGDPPRRS